MILDTSGNDSIELSEWLKGYSGLKKVKFTSKSTSGVVIELQAEMRECTLVAACLW